MSNNTSDNTTHPGPLADVRVLEFAGLGPAPFCGMLLADLGADVVRIDRASGPDYSPEDVESRGRHSIVLDLKQEDDCAIATALAMRADILIEGYRPGVMERLGLGPERLLELNPSLVYGRITGWGQHGPLAAKAGHDLNYLAITGALHAMGNAQQPMIPLNLVADFGGGALYLMMGIQAALHHARRTGEGQAVDCAMSDGVISLMNMIYGDFHAGSWEDRRESNVIDGAAPFYNVYECEDKKWLSLACIEKPFYENFLATAGLDQETLFTEQWNRENWQMMRDHLQTLFRSRKRDEWSSLFADTDACLTPVLSLAEAREYPHNQARASFQTIDDIPQAAAQPGLSHTPAATPFGVKSRGSSRDDILQRWQVKTGESG